MKKLIPLGLLLVLSIGIISAQECINIPTLVNGVVYSGNDINSPVVPDAQVDVTCNNNLLSDMTNAQGYYSVVYAPGECNIGSSVEACVGETCGQGIVQDCFDNPINILGIDIFNVPEFGLIAGVTAIAGALAGFMFLRKKN
jgi:hypothetical protein